jgi:hypothetical protein
MEDIHLENLDDESLMELLASLEGMKDELDNMEGKENE